MRMFFVTLFAVFTLVILLPIRAEADVEAGVVGALRAPGSISAPGDTGQTIDTLATQLATITTDTGAFAPGHRDFSRYTTVGLCLAASHQMQSNARRSLAAHRLMETLVFDTVGTGEVSQIARACGATRFTVATTSPYDLPALFELALSESDVSLAQGVLNKRLTLVHASNDSTGLYMEAINRYNNKGWQPEADSLVARVGAQFPGDWRRQRDLNGQMMIDIAWGGVGGIPNAGQPADSVRIRRYIDRVIHIAEEHADPSDSLNFFALWNAYTIRMHQIIWQGASPDSVRALAHRKQRDILIFKNNMKLVDSPHWHNFDHLTLEQILTDENFTPPWYTYSLRGGSVMAPRLQADYWFPAPGRLPTDTVRPMPGKVNLVCNGGIGTKDGEDDPENTTSNMAERIRNYLAQYGAEQLEVTVVWPVGGHYFRRFPGLYGWHLFQTTEEEAVAWRWYTQTYEQLPVSVAVQAKRDQRLPAPDRRLVSEARAQFNDFWKDNPDNGFQFAPDDTATSNRPGESSTACVVIDRAGKIAYAGEGEARIGGILHALFTPGFERYPAGGWTNPLSRDEWLALHKQASTEGAPR